MNNPFHPNNLDSKDKYVREFSELADLVLEIAELKKKIVQMQVSSEQSPPVHPAAKGFMEASKRELQNALDSLDRAAHHMHQAGNL